VWGARRLQLPSPATVSTAATVTAITTAGTANTSSSSINSSNSQQHSAKGQLNGQSNGQSNGSSGVHPEAAARQLAELCAEHSAELSQDSSVQFVLSYLQQLAVRLAWERAAVAKEHSSMLTVDGRKSPRHVRLSSDLGTLLCSCVYALDQHAEGALEVCSVAVAARIGHAAYATRADVNQLHILALVALCASQV
jgi:hypothetical protein